MRVTVRFLDGEQLEGESEALSLSKLGFPLSLVGLNSKAVWLSLASIKYVVVHPTDPTALGPEDPREAEGLPKVVLRFLDGDILRTYHDEVFGQEAEGLNVRVWDPESQRLRQVLVSTNVLKGVFFVDEWDGRSEDERTEQELKRRRRKGAQAEAEGAAEPPTSWRKWSSAGHRRVGRGTPIVPRSAPATVPTPATPPADVDLAPAPTEQSTGLPPRPVPAAEPISEAVEVVVPGEVAADGMPASEDVVVEPTPSATDEPATAASDVILHRPNETASEHPGALRRRMSQQLPAELPLPPLPPVADRPVETPPPPVAPPPSPLTPLPNLGSAPEPASGWPQPPGAIPPPARDGAAGVNSERRRLRSRIAETLGDKPPAAED